jgi:hypothetical protein
VSLAVALALTALAEEARAEELEQPRESRQHRSRDVLDRIDDPRPEPSWFETHVSFHRKGGLQYNDSFQVGDRQFVVIVRGPVRGRLERKELGLSFEIRF